jgi:hypothetical protein
MRAGVTATVAAALVVIAGLITLRSPSRARERRLDARRTSDLSMLASNIERYWLEHSALPLSLDSLVTAQQLRRVPMDPQRHEPYTYLVSGERSYRLCATFAQPSDSDGAPENGSDDIVIGSGSGGTPIAREPHSWRHGAGESCFDLTPPARDSK